MNKVYRIVWSASRQDWVVAHESAKGHCKTSTSKSKVLSLLLTGLLASAAQADPVASSTLPTGGQVTGGQATISLSGNALNIQQTSAKAAINWNSFSIGSGAVVNFVQPNSSAVALNRVVGSDPSSIYGQLNANGQVFLLNPNGVLFGRSARVDVGGLVATTLNLKDSDFFAGHYRLTGSGVGSVVNQGELLGKYVALLAPEVRNEGVIVARQGTVALAGSTGVTLSLVNSQLIDVLVDKADVNTLVENRHLIQADEGVVILSAQSASELLGKVVNSGSVQANGIAHDGGTVRLVASSEIEHSGSINVDAGIHGKGGTATLIADLTNFASLTTISGSISARGGSSSGDGGFVETSASHLKIANSAKVSTKAANGKVGSWLLDPTDFTVAASGGDMTGSSLGAALDSSSVIIDTVGGSCAGVTCPGGAGTHGDIFITDNVSWSASTSSLTLRAYRNIVIDGATITTPFIPPLGGFGPPPSYSLNMLFGQKTSGTYTIKNGATISGGGGFSDPPWLIAPDGSPMDAAALGGADYTSNPTAFVRLDSGQSSTYGNTPSINYTVYLAPAGTGASDLPGGVGVHSGTDSSGSTGWETSQGACSIFTPSECLLPTTHAGTTSFVYAGGITESTPNYYYIAGDGVSWTVNPRTLTATLTNSGAEKTKTYDGTTAAPVGFTPTYSFSGLISGDTAAALSDAGATYDSQHTTATTLTVNGLAITGITGSHGSVAGDYVLAATTAGASGMIDPIQLTATLTNSGTTKAYDGTNAAPGGFTPTYSFSGGLLTGDTAVALSNGGATFNSAHVATANSIVVSGLAMTGVTGSNGSLAGDYALTSTSASAAASITPVSVTATLTNSGTTKAYDGSNAGPGGFTPTYSVSGLIFGDSAAELSNTSALFNGTHVADTSGIVVSGLAITGITGSNNSTAGDYTLTSTSASASASITPATLTVTLSNGSITKVYDGTNAAPGSFTPTYSFTGFASGDTAATLSSTGASYNSQHTTATTLTVNGLAITGITGSNSSVTGDYTLAATTAGASASITPIQLTATLTNSGTTKVYDGSDAAPGGFTPTFNVTGSFLAGDTAASLTHTGAAFNGSHVVGTSSIIASGLSITGITGSNGSLAGDYALTASTASASATITPLMLTPTLSNSGTSKVYDGTTAAPTGFTPAVSTGTTVGTDSLTFSGTFAYDNKNVVGATSIATSTLQISGVTGSSAGSQLSDYGLTSSAVSAAATITPATLSSTTIGTKTDDGKDTIDGSLIKANGLTVNGVTEYFTFTGTGLLPDALVDLKTTATGALESVNTLALDTTHGVNGAIASNYTVPAYSSPSDFSITVTSVANDLTAVDIIKRVIAAQVDRSQRGTDTTTTDFWKKIKQNTGVTQDERDTVTQSVLKSVQKLCGPNCAVDEDTVAKVLGGVTGCSAGFALDGGSCTPEQKETADKEPATHGTATKAVTTAESQPDVTNKKDIVGVFQAYYGRLPTQAELIDWDHLIEAATKGLTGAERDKAMARAFDDMGKSGESTSLYGTDTLAFVSAVYQNALNRAADFSGLLYWAGEIDAGRLSKGAAAFNIYRAYESQVVPLPQPAPQPASKTVSETNKAIKSLVTYFKDAGADNAKMANYVNIANNVGGAGKTKVTDADVDWVTQYVQSKGQKVTRQEVENWLKGGQVTTAPALAPAPTQVNTPVVQQSSQVVSAPATSYTVQRGDTLFRIASRNNAAMDEIISANNLTPPYTLFVGQELLIPNAGRGATQTATPAQVGAKKEVVEPTSTTTGQTTPPVIDLGKKSAGAAAGRALNNDLTKETPPPIPDVTPATSFDAGASGLLLNSQTQGDGFHIAVVSAGDARRNTLLLNKSMPDQTITSGKQATIKVPNDLFATTNPDAQVTLTAKLANGQPMPNWLHFNPTTGAFEGTPPPGLKQDIPVRLTARDNEGREVSTSFKIKIGM